MDAWPDGWADETYCYLITTGRRTGRPHEIEIWFVVSSGEVVMISEGGQRSDWVRNVLVDPSVRLRLGPQEHRGRARLLENGPARELVGRALAAKYQGWREGQPLSEWARNGLGVAVGDWNAQVPG